MSGKFEGPGSGAGNGRDLGVDDETESKEPTVARRRRTGIRPEVVAAAVARIQELAGDALPEMLAEATRHVLEARSSRSSSK